MDKIVITELNFSRIFELYIAKQTQDSDFKKDIFVIIYFLFIW